MQQLITKVLSFHPASWFYIAGSMCFIVGTVLKEVLP